MTEGIWLECVWCDYEFFAPLNGMLHKKLQCMRCWLKNEFHICPDCGNKVIKTEPCVICKLKAEGRYIKK